MSRYYYDKHHIKSDYVPPYTYYFNDTGWRYSYQSVVMKGDTGLAWVDFDFSRGFSGGGSASVNGIGSAIYKVNSPTQARADVVESVRDGNSFFAASYLRTCSSGQAGDYYNYTKGAFIETIIAEDGAYPNDDRQDGYWWVKRGLAFPQMPIRIGGNQKISDNGWIRISGQIKEIDRIFTRIDGVIKEVQ